MVIERFRDGDPDPVGERFRARGRMLPDGVTYAGSWIDPAAMRCFQLVDAPGRALVDAWIMNWHDIVDFDVVEVVEPAAFWASRSGASESSVPALRQAARSVRASGDFRWVGIYRVTAAHVHLLAFDGPGPPSYPTFALGKGLSTRAVTERRTVVADDTANDASYLEAFATTAAEIIVPVFGSDGTVIGTLDVESDRAGAFTAGAARSLEAAAAALPAAILAAPVPDPLCEIQLRDVTSDDAEAIARIYAPSVEASADSFEEIAPDAAEIRRRIASTVPAYPWCVVEVDGAVAGYAYACAHRTRAAYRTSVDVSVYVDPAAQRRGLARLLYGAVFRQLAERGYHRAFAGIVTSNEASIAFHRSVGFTPVGVYHEVGYKLGRWHDVSWWERDVTGFAEPPQAGR
jgi:L-amino acid N-acyltransferase YncA/putative methionine-R-sulfoxide reductase with GAF domain